MTDALAEISTSNSSAPWIWFACSLVAYASFLALNPLAGIGLRAYLLVRSRPHLWLIPVAFGIAAVALSLTVGEVPPPPGTLPPPQDIATQALDESWKILPTFPHILVTPYPLSVVAAALLLCNVGGVLGYFFKSRAWSGRVAHGIGVFLVLLTAVIHLGVGGADLVGMGFTPPFPVALLSQTFALLTGMFAQAYLIAAVIIATAPAHQDATGSSGYAGAALFRASECFPRVLPFVSLYLVVWALDTYGGSAATVVFARRFIIPEILLVLAFLPPAALVVRGGFPAVGGVALGALIRSWWVWLWGLATLFLTIFLARFANAALDLAWPLGTTDGTAWRLIFPLLWGAVSTWILVAWILAFREAVLPAAGARQKNASSPSSSKSSSPSSRSKPRRR